MLEEDMQELVKKLSDEYSRFVEIQHKTSRLHEKIEKDIASLKRENSILLNLVTKKFEYQNEVLSKTHIVVQNAEETLLNVLLAIRQNEYLQSYHPEQSKFE